MNTEKRLIIALVITFGFFLFYSRFLPQQKPIEQQVITQAIEQQEVVEEKVTKIGGTRQHTEFLARFSSLCHASSIYYLLTDSP